VQKDIAKLEGKLAFALCEQFFPFLCGAPAPTGNKQL
jgi:hypothetical protein